MPKPFFGEADFKVDGQTLTLRYDFNAMIEVEEAAGSPLSEVMREMASGKPRLATARAMLFGMLRHHHPDLELEDAGNLLLAGGGAAAKAMEKAIIAGNPPANPRKGAANPPLTTGTRSSRPGRKRA